MEWEKLFYSIMKDPLQKQMAQSFFDHDDVEYIEIISHNENYEIKGVVKVFEIKHECTITFTHEGKLQTYVCDCKWCDEYSICSHIGAVLIKVGELRPKIFPYIYQNPSAEEKQNLRNKIREEIYEYKLNERVFLSRNIIEFEKKQYIEKIMAAVSDEQFELIPEIETMPDHTLRVTYRIGNDKKYIVKNIEGFVSRIENHENFRYGKSLEFLHQESAFDEFSRKQIAFLQKCVANNLKKRAERIYYYDDVPSIHRYLIVNNDNIDDFYDIYKDEGGSNFYCDVLENRIHIKVEEEKDLYRYLLGNIEISYSGKSHLYKFEQCEETLLIYRYSLDGEGKALRFISQLCEHPVDVLKSENKKFYKYVLSDIEKYLDIDEVDNIVEESELIKLYADINELDQMYVKLDYYSEQGKIQQGFDEHAVTSYTQDLIETYIKKYADVIDYDSHSAFFDMECEETYEFIYNGFTKLNEYCEIYVSDALKKIGYEHKYSISVGVRLNNNLLEIDVNSLDIPKEELSQVLRAYRRKKKFYHLKNGELLNLKSQDLDELNQFIEDYHISIDDISKESLIPSYRMLTMEEDMQDAQNISYQRDEKFEEHLKTWHEQTSLANIPEKYETILRDYQKYGFQWLSLLNSYGFNGILADDMGLGKTLQVIALLESHKGQGTSLVVCPASLIYNWEEEVSKFTSSLKTCCVCGSVQDRKNNIRDYRKYDLLITSYDYMRRDVDLYEDLKFYYVILDEAQNIKNQKTKNAITVKKLNTMHKLALTGTPIENSLAELWSIFDFLMPDYLYNYHYFQSHFENDIVKNNDDKKQKKLKKMVSPFILRRNKADVLKELPPKIEKNYLIDFNEEESKLYFAHLAQVNSQLSDMVYGSEKIDKIAILAMLTKLRQICCEPRLLFENIENPSSKFQACMELIRALKEQNQKVLLFSSFTSVLDLLGEQLYKEGISYYMLTGKTSKEERKQLVHQFQNDLTTVFLISLKAGGTGLNLTAAEAVIHYDPWWNQSAQNQATDRAHRIGQIRNVQVFKLIMKNSIEEKIQKLQLMKKELADMFVENNEGSIAKMSKEEIIELFKM